MRKVFLVITLGLLCISTFAQTIDFSAINRLQNREVVKNIIGSDDSLTYVLKKQNATFSASRFDIDVYDQKLNKISNLPIELPFSDNNVNFNIKEIFVYNRTPYVYYESDDRNSNHLTAMVFNCNKKASIVLKSMMYDKTNRQPQFSIKSDSSGVLLVAQPPYNKFNHETYDISRFDKNLSLLWEEKIELPYESKNFTLEKIKLHNDNVFILGNTNHEKSFENPDKFVLIRFDNSTKSIKEFELSLTGKWITSATFEIANKSQLYVGGFYSNDKSFSIAGTFFLSIDLITNQISDKSIKPFSENFLSEFLPPRKVKKGGELSSFYFDHFIVKPNGGAIFVAEQYYKSISSYSDITSGFMNYSTIYYYNDIIVVSVDEFGQIDWTKKIAKRQYSTNDYGYFLSYALTYKNNTLYLYFNDHPRNINLPNREQNLRYMNYPQRATITQVKINEQGDLLYSTIKNEKNNLILRPKLAYITPDHRLIMLSEKSKMYGLIQITP